MDMLSKLTELGGIFFFLYVCLFSKSYRNQYVFRGSTISTSLHWFWFLVRKHNSPTQPVTLTGCVPLSHLQSQPQISLDPCCYHIDIFVNSYPRNAQSKTAGSWRFCAAQCRRGACIPSPPCPQGAASIHQQPQNSTESNLPAHPTCTDCFPPLKIHNINIFP